MDPQLLIAVLTSIVLLLLLVLYFRLHAFVSLLLAAIVGGLIAGLSGQQIIQTVTQGMGNTLGYVAIVIGLGAILGGVLEHSGGTQRLASWLLKSMGHRRASLAFVLAGFLIAIPVFFDVGFILLVPMVYAMQRKTGDSALYFAIPLLAGLATTHALIPPTPGPIAVAELLGAELGWVIALGTLAGIPTVLVAGVWWGRLCGKRIFVASPRPATSPTETQAEPPPVLIILTLILLPVVLILGNTGSTMLVDRGIVTDQVVTRWLQFLGHPYVALLITCLLAMIWLRRRGVRREALQQLATKALQPVGTIILITGAGGAYKQMLVDSGAGEQLAQWTANTSILPPILAFMLAAAVRILQGSATVAMVTAAGLLAPTLPAMSFSKPELALLVLSIASGASTLSHVNDSGFWLVKEYLGLTESQTLQTWTMTTVILSLTSLAMVVGMWFVV